MPLKVPFTGHVLQGHRGHILTEHQDNPLVKALSSQPKDVLASPRRAGQAQGARVRQPLLPSLSLTRLSPYTAYPTTKSVKKAAARGTVMLDRAHWIAPAVQGHIRGGVQRILAGNPAFVPLVLVGQSRSSESSSLISLAAVAALPNSEVLLQVRGNEMARIEQQARRMDALGVVNFQAAQAQFDQAMNSTHEAAALAQNVLVSLVAGKGGSRIGHFDAAPDAEPEFRRHRMAQEIQARLNVAQGPVVVLVDSQFLPELHDDLKGFQDPIALAAVENAHTEPVTAAERRGASYLFANEDILKLRFEDRHGQAVNPFQFAGNLVPFGNLLPQNLQVT